MIRFNTSAYQRAMVEFNRSVIYGLSTLHPVIGPVQQRATIHGGPVRNVAGPAPVDHPMFRVASQVEMPLDVIRQSLLDEYALGLVDMAGQYCDQLTERFVQLIREVTDATGNTVDAGGKILTHDLVLDVVEQSEIDFDEEGNPVLPTVMLNSQGFDLLARTEPTETHRRRFEEIIASKKAAHDAQKRHRRLSG